MLVIQLQSGLYRLVADPSGTLRIRYANGAGMTAPAPGLRAVVAHPTGGQAAHLRDWLYGCPPAGRVEASKGAQPVSTSNRIGDSPRQYWPQLMAVGATPAYGVNRSEPSMATNAAGNRAIARLVDDVPTS